MAEYGSFEWLITRPYGPEAMSVKDRLEKYKVVDPRTDCWLWQGHTKRNGYGEMSVPKEWQALGYKRREMVHRVAYHAYRNVNVAKLYVKNIGCTNRACFNPVHWTLMRHPIGNRKLTDQQIAAVRSLQAQGVGPKAIIETLRLPVGPRLIYAIGKGERHGTNPV